MLNKNLLFSGNKYIKHISFNVLSHAWFHRLGCKGGGAVQDSLSCPQPTWVSKVKLFCSLYLFKLSAFENISIIIRIQVQIIFVAWLHMLSYRGGGKLLKSVYRAPLPQHA